MSHEVVAPVSGSVVAFHRIYLGDGVTEVVVALALLDTCVCCDGGNACSSKDCFVRNRRLDGGEAVEEEPNEKESTTATLIKHNKNRAICICAIILRKGDQCTFRIIIIITIRTRTHFFRSNEMIYDSVRNKEVLQTLRLV
jgi:hypothetical protein